MECQGNMLVGVLHKASGNQDDAREIQNSHMADSITPKNSVLQFRGPQCAHQVDVVKHVFPASDELNRDSLCTYRLDRLKLHLKLIKQHGASR